MTAYDLDDVDRQLLVLLQDNARYTATELAERVGVSDNTVHNRMERLEEEGVISGYTTSLDYDRAGYSLHFAFSCTAPISERSRVAAEVLEFPEVIEVTELMSGQRNLLIKAVGDEDDDITRLAENVDQLDLEIEDENLVREEHRQPLDLVEVERRLEDES